MGDEEHWELEVPGSTFVAERGWSFQRHRNENKKVPIQGS